MPRANRYIVAGHVYHLTHRCHNREFLLNFATDRNQYRRRLREAMMGWRKRNRLLDLQKLLWLLRASSLAEFQSNFNAALENAMINDELQRQEKWTQAAAIGSREFVDAIAERIHYRRRMDSEEDSGAWVLRETYGAVFGHRNPPIESYRGV